VCVKEATKQLVQEPAEFEDKEVKVQTDAGHTDWEINKDPLCKPPAQQPTRDVYCLVQHPPAEQTLHPQCQKKPACVKGETIPAEYQTVGRKKCSCPATTKRIPIPAEYQTVEKTVKVCDGRMAWQRVICETTPRNEAVSQTPPPRNESVSMNMQNHRY